MNIQQLRDIHQATPFRPFSIHLADGRVFLIPYREFLSYSPTGRTAVVFQIDDSFSVLDLLLVTELEVHASSKDQGAA